ncbi:centrosomal protein of 78 kDa [Chelonus insularis]|uniref:centrosomal protein of 78 kDa n=1 Tax=Chelonus insularis TaxID=460826 RepID=UPI00158C141E|nr:centrosomal protein of 78 kDa [Chelonus insularis]
MALPSGQNFATCYVQLCKQQRVRPLPVICVTLPHSLDFTTDRVKMDDWGPILNSLSLDRSLKSVSVRSRWYLQGQKSFEDCNNTENKRRAVSKTSPVTLTRYLLEWLSQSIAQCVRNSPTLTYLELEGVPLPTDCLAALCVGLASTETLQHLSLRRCYIGDNNCALICRTVADVHSIRSLNLSQCNLSANCGLALASTLCRQKLLLYHDAWKDSLRYREPNPEAMPGLRRLTLNGNPHLGDSAVAQVIDAIQDSLWLKALDLQNCGLTDAIGNKIIELLDNNKTLEVLDVRLNLNLNNDMVQEIFERLATNNGGCNLKYRPLSLPQKNNKAVKELKRTNDVNKNKMLRSKSMIITKTERPYHLNGFSHNMRPSYPSLIDEKRRKTRLLTSYSVHKAKNKIAEKNPRKVSLHLDLQAQMQSIGDSWKNTDQIHQDQLSNNHKRVCNKPQENEREVEGAKSHYKFQDLLKQLSDVKMEKNKLLKNTQKIQVELEEERTRRQTIETKLWTMKKDLADLENAFKAKEMETRGFLRTSQQSFDNISASFEKLSEIINNCASNPKVDLNEEEEKAEEETDKSFSLSEDENETKVEDKVEKEVIKVAGDDEKEAMKTNVRRKVDFFIRKSKSEKLYRDFLQVVKSSKKLSQSENDMRAYDYLLKFGSLTVQKIGDRPDSVSSSSNSSYRRYENVKPLYSPCERARAIFSEIVNSDIALNLGSSHGT